MKILTFVLLLICVSKIKCWEVNEVEGIVGEPILVLFDSQSNGLIIAQDPESFTLRRLYKLDPQKKILSEVDITDSLVNYFINSNDDFYLTTWSPDGVTLISAMKAGSLTLERIAYIGSWELVYTDSDNNLLYSIEGSGVYFLKYNSTEAVRVQNLENFVIRGDVITDKDGNTYLGGSITKEDGNKTNQLVVIIADSKETTPEGLVIDGVFDNPANEFIYDLAITGNNELLISISNGGTIGVLKKYSENAVTTILSGEQYQYYKLEGNDKIIIITSCDYNALLCRLSYLTLGGEIFGISNLSNKTTVADNFKNVINKEGNVFISSLNKVDQSSLEFLSYAETETIPIDFDSPVEIKIYNIDLDGNENLWILTSNQGVFYLEKGSFSPESVQGTKDLTASQFRVDKRTNEVFLQTETGLYVITI